MSFLLERFASLASAESRHRTTTGRVVSNLMGSAFALTGVTFMTPNVGESVLTSLGLEIANSNGLVELKAWYGGMELALGSWMLVCGTAEQDCLLGACIMFGCSTTRFVCTKMNFAKHATHVYTGLLEAFGCVVALIGWRFEIQARLKANKIFRLANRTQMPNPTKLDDFVPFSYPNLQNPYPWFKAVRTQAPSLYKPIGKDFFVCCGYSDVCEIAKNTQLFSSNLVQILLDGGGTQAKVFESQGIDVGIVDVLALADPPAHTTQRRLAMKGLNPKLFKLMEEGIRHETRALLKGLQGEIEFMSKFALKLPILVVLKLLDFPTENAKLHKKRADHGVALLAAVSTPEEFAEHAMASLKLYRWVQKQINKACDDSTKPSKSQFVQALCESVRERKLTRNDASSMCFQLVLAGNDSSASTMGSIMKILCENQDLILTLRANPELIPDAVEETLRLESPFHGHYRKVTQDSVFQSVDLKKGDRVMLCWGSANRDERFFGENANEFDLGRKNKSKHLSFGFGVHKCMGWKLASMEVAVVVEELLGKYSTIEFVDRPQSFAYLNSAFVRSLDQLWVRLEE